MKFSFDLINKVLFGWSAKCGCTHVKKIYTFLSSYEKHKILLESENIDDSLFDFTQYKIFIVIRNPYERLVSGFLDKYKTTGQCNAFWNKNTSLTFRNFVNELIKCDFKMVEEHHFTPQLSEEWCDSMKNNKDLIVYDIYEIDYDKLEKLYNTKIPFEIRNNKHNENKNREIIDYPIYDLPLQEYENKKPFTYCFYDDDIRAKVESFYKYDFEFFKEMGFQYNIENYQSI